jgi:2'-hydroxyisoflavone reductase
VTGASTKITWAPVEFLSAQGLIASALEATPNFPLWNPPTGDTAGVGLVKCDRAVAKGMKFRTLEQTIRDTLAWQKTRSPEDQKLKAGLKPEREAELLKLLHTA